MHRILAIFVSPFLVAWTLLPPKLEVLDKDEFLVTCQEKIEACAEKAASYCKSDIFTAIDTSYQVDEKILKPSKCPGDMLAQEVGGKRICSQNPASPPTPGAPKGVVTGPALIFMDSVDARKERREELNHSFKVRYSCDPDYLKRKSTPAVEVLDSGEE
jgi:hypothetical protein